jgi:hypothetical protein
MYYPPHRAALRLSLKVEFISHLFGLPVTVSFHILSALSFLRAPTWWLKRQKITILINYNYVGIWSVNKSGKKNKWTNFFLGPWLKYVHVLYNVIESNKNITLTFVWNEYFFNIWENNRKWCYDAMYMVSRASDSVLSNSVRMWN